MEGRSYTIGRSGHIRIDDPALSRGHAEIKFTNGKILLRDLESTNGTYLIVNNKLIEVDQTYVNPNQRILMGTHHYRIRELLSSIGIYISYSDRFGLIVKMASSVKKPILKLTA